MDMYEEYSKYRKLASVDFMFMYEVYSKYRKLASVDFFRRVEVNVPNRTIEEVVPSSVYGALTH